MSCRDGVGSAYYIGKFVSIYQDYCSVDEIFNLLILYFETMQPLASRLVCTKSP